jgi:hypothetical protein
MTDEFFFFWFSFFGFEQVCLFVTFTVVLTNVRMVGLWRFFYFGFMEAVAGFFLLSPLPAYREEIPVGGEAITNREKKLRALRALRA